jgi:flagellar hook-associated protein 1 FlgK
LAGQLRAASSEFYRSDVFAELASVLDNLLADQQTGINASLQSFTNALQDVADDPASQSARQVFLSEARNLVSRFASLEGRLVETGREVNARVNASVSEIHSLGASIADVNRQILASGVAPGSAGPPDLLDQRDRLLERLSELVKVDTVSQTDGTASVFIGSGQVLVLGTQSSSLAVTPGRFDPEQSEIVLRGAGPDVNVTPFISGGVLGGALDFQREMLADTRAQLGRIALGIVDTFNTAHANGMDLNGALGGDLFSAPAPLISAATTNTGAGTAAVTITDLGSIEATDYRLAYDGASYSLLRADTGALVPMTGSGTGGDPFLADGLAIVVGGTPAAGDQLELRTVSHIPGSMSVLVDHPARVAAAAPTRTSVGLSNSGTASISAGRVVDVTDPNLLTTSTIEFLEATTYSITGMRFEALPNSFSYTCGGVNFMGPTIVPVESRAGLCSEGWSPGRPIKAISP